MGPCRDALDGGAMTQIRIANVSKFFGATCALSDVSLGASRASAEVIVLAEQDDHINPAGVKRTGELGNVGTNAAVCNAIFHATDQRLRKLPARLGKREW
jgi:hypothetical protein